MLLGGLLPLHRHPDIIQQVRNATEKPQAVLG
jgi:hypothetical protein